MLSLIHILISICGIVLYSRIGITPLCKKAPAASSWRLGFSYNKKGMIGPKGAIMPNSLYPSGSYEWLPHFAVPNAGDQRSFLL